MPKIGPFKLQSTASTYHLRVLKSLSNNEKSFNLDASFINDKLSQASVTLIEYLEP